MSTREACPSVIAGWPEGSNNPIFSLTRHDRNGDPATLWRSAPLPPVRRVVEFLRVHHIDAFAKAAEIPVLRQQAGRASTPGPRFKWSDRAIVSGLVRLVPRGRWAAFLISPETILRWSRRLRSGVKRGETS